MARRLVEKIGGNTLEVVGPPTEANWTSLPRVLNSNCLLDPGTMVEEAVLTVSDTSR